MAVVTVSKPIPIAFNFEERTVKTSAIPDAVTISSGTYQGTFTKRRGSQRDRNLFCWFNDQTPSFVPHVSIDISSTHDDWEVFHVSFPIMKNKPWSNELERMSYSVHFKINRETDVITETSKTNADNWSVPREGQVVMSRADMDRKALEFAKVFYSSAFFGARGA